MPCPHPPLLRLVLGHLPLFYNGFHRQLKSERAGSCPSFPRSVHFEVRLAVQTTAIRGKQPHAKTNRSINILTRRHLFEASTPCFSSCGGRALCSKIRQTICMSTRKWNALLNLVSVSPIFSMPERRRSE